MQVNQSAMRAHADFLASSSHNVANANTNQYDAKRTVLENSLQGSVKAVHSSTSEGTKLAREMTDQISIENGFDAQIGSIQTKDEMIGSLLNIKS
ncbi:MAG: flagellar biosynthesis protein FlgE [Campylobacteraceae bacterium]|nr:flagellar biosynthesis protein FlgE [Campylobacteraceae bacterium]